MQERAETNATLMHAAHSWELMDLQFFSCDMDPTFCVRSQII